MRKIIALVLMFCLILGMVPTPAYAAFGKATASTIRLEKIVGTVNIVKASGKKVTAKNDMKLYNGYTISTGAKSYAYISLDTKKAIKLSSRSSVEIQKNGKKLEIKLKSGNVFFNVTEKLADDEKLDIRTSTMVTSIRGTAGWVSEDSEKQRSDISLLEGTIEVKTVKGENFVIHGGQTVELSMNSAINPNIEKIAEVDIPAFVKVEVSNNPALQEKIEASTEMSVDKIVENAEEYICAEELAEETAIEQVKKAELAESDSKGKNLRELIYGASKKYIFGGHKSSKINEIVPTEIEHNLVDPESSDIILKCLNGECKEHNPKGYKNCKHIVNVYFDNKQSIEIDNDFVIPENNELHVMLKEDSSATEYSLNIVGKSEADSNCKIEIKEGAIFELNGGKIDTQNATSAVIIANDGEVILSNGSSLIANGKTTIVNENSGQLTISKESLIDIENVKNGFTNKGILVAEKGSSTEDGVKINIKNCNVGLKNTGTLTIGEYAKINIEGCEVGIENAGKFTSESNGSISINGGTTGSTGIKNLESATLENNGDIAITDCTKGIENGAIGFMYSESATLENNGDISITDCTKGIENGAIGFMYLGNATLENNGTMNISCGTVGSTGIKNLGIVTLENNGIMNISCGTAESTGIKNLGSLTLENNGDISITDCTKGIENGAIGFMYSANVKIENNGDIFITDCTTGIKNEDNCKITFDGGKLVVSIENLSNVACGIENAGILTINKAKLEIECEANNSFIINTGSTDMTGGSIECNMPNNGIMIVKNKGSFTMKGGVINHTSKYGKTVSNRGKFTMENSVINKTSMYDDNNTDNYVISNDDGTCTMSEGVINYRCPGNDPAIELSSGGTFEMKDNARVILNSSGHSINCPKSTNFEMNGGAIIQVDNNNKAIIGNGGTIKITNGTIFMPNDNKGLLPISQDKWSDADTESGSDIKTELLGDNYNGEITPIDDNATFYKYSYGTINPTSIMLSIEQVSDDVDNIANDSTLPDEESENLDALLDSTDMIIEEPKEKTDAIENSETLDNEKNEEETEGLGNAEIVEEEIDNLDNEEMVKPEENDGLDNTESEENIE